MYSFDIQIAKTESGFCYVIAQELEGPNVVTTQMLEWGEKSSLEEVLKAVEKFIPKLRECIN